MYVKNVLYVHQKIILLECYCFVCTKKISLNIYILQHLSLFSLYWWQWFQWNLFYLVYLVDVWLFMTYDNNPAWTVDFFFINIAITSYDYHANVQRIKKWLWKSLLSCIVLISINVNAIFYYTRSFRNHCNMPICCLNITYQCRKHLWCLIYLYK